MRPSKLAFVFFGVLAATVQAAEIRVPGDHATIQAAIDVAVPGDVVLLGEEIYRENISLRPGVTVQGADPEKTTLRGDLGEGPVVRVPEKVTDCTLANLTIRGTGGVESEDGYPSLIRVVEATLTLRNCKVVDAPTDGMSVKTGGSVTIEGCTFEGCAAPAFWLESAPCSATVRDSVFKGNQKAVSLYDGATCTFERVTVEKCTSSGVALIGAGTSFVARDSTFSRNDRDGISILYKAKLDVRGCTMQGNKENGINAQSGVELNIEACTA